MDRQNGEKSYWTKRRKVLSNVDSFLSSYAQNTEIITENCATNQGNQCVLETCSIVTVGRNNPSEATDVPATCSTDTGDSVTQRAEGITRADNVETWCESDVGSDTGCAKMSDEDTDLSDDVFADETNLSGELVKWYIRFGISLDALGALLKVLHNYHPSLPIDARTLLKTPNTCKVNIRQMQEGQYCHFGVESGIQNMSKQGYLDSAQISKEISLQVNIDGLPLFKSTNYQLWPILGMITDLPVKRPFTIGVYGGNHKPSDLSQYLNEFVKECQHLEINGICVNGSVLEFKLHSIVCDAPARSFLRNTKGHNAYGGCDRCRQVGLWRNKVIFPDTVAEKRTDDGFRNQIDEEYHNGTSPILCLSINIVEQFPLDYMHLVCLGVMRRLLMAWLKGPLTCRLPSSSVLKISDRLLTMRQFVSSEFCRRPRALSDLDRYKATEFRQTLLYTGIVAFRGIVADEVYCHFLLLSVAIRCLVSRELCKSHADYAKKLLVMFVDYAAKLYGEEFLVYNVHCLVHLSDDVQRFGPLDNISCFPFENYLKQLKKTVRSSHLPFQQVISRLSEMNTHGVNITNNVNIDAKPVCHNAHTAGPVADGYEYCLQYRSVKTHNFTLNLSDRDSCVIVSDGSVGTVKNILSFNSETYLALSLYQTVTDLFDYPLLSSELDMYRVCHLKDTLSVINLDQLRYKCVRLPLDNSAYAVIPLIHSFY